MFKPVDDLSGCRILISNDDGINAPGLEVLEKIARTLSDDVWVVAPAHEQSGAGHSLTLHQPLRPTQLGEKRFMVDGTPTDCVLVAGQHLMADRGPDLVLSGINMGANLGEDVHYSGTVAAALEATLQDIPAIAFSQLMSGSPRWDTAEHYAADLVRSVCKLGWGRNTLININFPDLPVSEVKGVKLERQGKHKLGDDLVVREDPRGKPYIWIGAPRVTDTQDEGTDLNVTAAGYVSVTPLCVDLTDHDAFSALRQALE
ncbi:MAG: 5'/3'-nucleotidase SurE [Rhodospirillaceae bacterium]|nr:5'/3'-nucleotidase SurE [Rhodospirillaceae bacterium]